jgi:DNA-binding XRE family transcriptional regulator
MNIDETRLYAHIGHRIRTRRIELEKSQAWLADQVHLRRTSISNIEAGQQKLPLHTLYAVSIALDTCPRTLLPAPQEVAIERDEEVVIDEMTRQMVPPQTAHFLRSLVNETEEVDG